MIEELFHIGPLAISPFGVMLMLAFLAAYAQLSWGMRRLGAGDADDASTIMLWAGIGGIVGAKIYYAILYGDWHLLFDRAGLVWYGGLILGAVAVFVVMARRRLAPWLTADAAAPALALGYGIGRIGCFLVGDDYGVPTDLPWGVAFAHGPTPSLAGFLRSDFGVDIPANVPADTLMRVHPTQLYETTLAVIIFLIGRRLLKRQARPGTTALVVVALLACERFAVEILRAKDDRFFGTFTLAQVISVAVLVGLAALALQRRRNAAPSRPGGRDG
jgi:phosphatidylglycerol:prolipoprotein diacylglycerol transferase